MGLAAGQVQLQALQVHALQHRQRRQRRRVVGAHGAQRDAFDVLGQVRARGEDAVGDLVLVQRQPCGRVGGEVVDDHLAGAAGVRRQRRDHGQAVAAGRIARGDVHHRRHVHHVEQLEHLLLAAQAVVPVPQPRLAHADQPGQLDQRMDIRQGIVGALLGEPVRAGQVFQLEAGRAVLAGRPDDAFGPQRLAQAYQVDQVPARVAVFPLAAVRLVEVPVQHLPGELVVEAQRVVADPAGARRRQLFVHAGSEFGLADAFALGLLRRDAGDQAGVGVGRHLQRRLAVEHHRFADDLQFHVGADAGELQRPVAPRVGAGGLVVVPEEGLHRAMIAWPKAGPAWD